MYDAGVPRPKEINLAMTWRWAALSGNTSLIATFFGFRQLPSELTERISTKAVQKLVRFENALSKIWGVTV